jgi:hypothetical protein
VRLDVAKIGIGHPSGGVGTNGLEHVLDRHVVTGEPTRRNRPTVQNQPGDIESRERHRSAGDGLVAADEDDDGVEEIAASHEFD